jgi:hypothetical protein
LWVLGPSSERLKYLLAKPDEWIKPAHSVVYPRALAVAVDADILGEQVVLQQSLDEAERLYKALAPELIALPEALPFHALFLALRGDSAAAVAEVERAIAAVPPSADASIAYNIRVSAVYTLARAGAKDRAVEVLKSLVDKEQVGGVRLHSEGAFLYHDKLNRAVLGDDPRYQGLMRQIEAKFEKL